MPSDQERFRRLDVLREEARRRLFWMPLNELFGQVMATLRCTPERAEEHIRNRLLNGLHTQWADTGRDAPYADVVWAVVEICFAKGVVRDEWGTREWRKLWIERKSVIDWLRKLAATLPPAPPVEQAAEPPPENADADNTSQEQEQARKPSKPREKVKAALKELGDLSHGDGGHLKMRQWIATTYHDDELMPDSTFRLYLDEARGNPRKR